ncbi:MAG TPA: hypothetical protein VFB21_08755 [Chthonomonadaceae bacterium]|nr:hypothetical protein [Chthonomonadaceae bacterium]
MAQPQIKPKRIPPRVIEGTPQEITLHLKELDAEERLTLLIPGKELGTNGVASSEGKQALSFEEVFGPLQQGFEESGMTEEELGELIDAELKAVRAERQVKEQSVEE